MNLQEIADKNKAQIDHANIDLPIDKEMLLESTKSAIVIIALDGMILQKNHYFDEIFLDDYPNLLNLKEIRLSNTYTFCNREKWLQELLEEGDNVFPKIEIKLKDMLRYFTIMSTIFRGDGVTSTIITMTDITKVVELHKKEVEINKELAYKQGIFDVTSEYIHNIGNIVTGAKSYLDKIRNNLLPLQKLGIYFQKIGIEIENIKNTNLEQLDPAYDKSIKVMSMGLKILESTISDTAKNILEGDLEKLSKAVENIAQTISYQQEIYKKSNFLANEDDINFDSLLKDLINVTEDNLTKNDILMELDIQENLIFKFNRINLFNGLLNLITNSIYFIKKANDENLTTEKKITFKAYMENEQEIFFDFDSMGDGETKVVKNVIFEIIDTGYGMTEEILQKLFTRGFSTRKGGHGLGLHSFANFLKESGGGISVVSDGIGKGSFFKIAIPFKEAYKGEK